VCKNGTTVNLTSVEDTGSPRRACSGDVGIRERTKQQRERGKEEGEKN